MWSTLEIIGVSLKYQTLIYIKTTYGIKVIIYLNEHESFAISKLSWTNILKHLLWVYYCYAEIEWVLNEI